MIVGTNLLPVTTGPMLVRGDRADREAHKTLLADAVDGRELATLDDVLPVAGDVPGRLRLARVRAGRQRRVPVELLGAGVPPKSAYALWVLCKQRPRRRR